MWTAFLPAALLPLAWALRNGPVKAPPPVTSPLKPLPVTDLSRQSAAVTVSVPRNGEVVQETIPWLRFSYVPPQPETITDTGGMFGGHEFFVQALTKGLSEDTVQKLLHCGLGVFGGMQGEQAQKTKELGPAPVKVWIFANGETATGQQFWEQYRKHVDPNDRMVILGNWWNETQESFHSPEVTSLWVPFASLSFAERRTRTPLDLVNRSKINYWGHELLVGYQQHGCQPGRERFWDTLNEELAKFGLRGHALGNCNGLMQMGVNASKELRAIDSTSGTFYDHSVRKYEHFRFMWTSEHNTNRFGYVTEKIVDAFLAGAVPIYAGAAQIREVFTRNNFIQVDWTTAGNQLGIDLMLKAMANPAVYRQLLRPHEPVVTDDVMRKFFTWHPAVWSRYGDGLRQRILAEALAKCDGLAGPS